MLPTSKERLTELCCLRPLAFGKHRQLQNLSSGCNCGALRAIRTIPRTFIISTTSASPINDTYGNLPDRETVDLNDTKLQASYTRGEGNDPTLTSVP